MTKTTILLIYLIFATKITANSQLNSSVYGALSPNVKVVDIDDIYSISNGICVVKKGNKTALMDIDGTILTPWGKYTFVGETSMSGIQHYGSGLVKVRDNATFKVGFVDKNGREIVPAKFYTEELGNYDVRGLCPLRKRNSFQTETFLDNKGNAAFTINENNFEYRGWESYQEFFLNEKRSQNLFLIRKYSNDKKSLYKYGFVNSAIKVVIAPAFEEANYFSEGRASVVKSDDFGVKRWGYIDTTGELVIPYKFRIEPGAFHAGLALVEANEASDFKYAYIDKSGNIKIKVPRFFEGSYLYPVPFDFGTRGGYPENDLKGKGFFFNGYSLWSNAKKHFFMDTAGNLTSQLNFLMQRYPLTDSFKITITNITDKGIGILVDKKSDINDVNIAGVISFSGTVIYQPIYYSLELDYFSSYALASTLIVDNLNPTKKVYRKGIINKEGIFTLIINEKKTPW